MKGTITYLSIILLWASLANAQELFTINIFGEKIPFEAELDRNTWKHTVREASLTTMINSYQYIRHGRPSPGLARAIGYGINVVYEFGQAGWGGRVSFTDILAGIAGTEIANIPWYFIHKRKKREYKFKFEKKIWHVTVEEVHH